MELSINQDLKLIAFFSSFFKKKKSNWRQQHANFIKNLRYAKKVTEMEKTGQDMSHLPPPPVTENPDYVKCPHCSRSFNPTTAERHIPRCKAPPRMR